MYAIAIFSTVILTIIIGSICHGSNFIRLLVTGMFFFICYYVTLAIEREPIITNILGAILLKIKKES